MAPFLDQLEGQDDWRSLAAVLRRILGGERDAGALLGGLDGTDTIIVGDVLEGLGVAFEPAFERGMSGTAVAAEAEGDGAAEEAEGEGLTLDRLLDLVAQACRPDAPAGLAEQLHAVTRTLASDASMPAEIRALGRVLNAVLSGERAPDLSALPPTLAEAVRRMLVGV